MKPTTPIPRLLSRKRAKSRDALLPIKSVIKNKTALATLTPWLLDNEPQRGEFVLEALGQWHLPMCNQDHRQIPPGKSAEATPPSPYVPPTDKAKSALSKILSKIDEFRTVIAIIGAIGIVATWLYGRFPNNDRFCALKTRVDRLDLIKTHDDADKALSAIDAKIYQRDNVDRANAAGNKDLIAVIDKDVKRLNIDHTIQQDRYVNTAKLLDDTEDIIRRNECVEGAIAKSK